MAKEKLAFIGLCVGIMAFGKEAKIGRTLAEIDCTREYPTNLYFECGKVIVTNSVAGAYREAAPGPDSRFGYRFAIKRVGKPHLAIVRYPDDKTRCMSVSDGTCYDLSIGVFTGKAQPHGKYMGLAQPLTGTMKEIRQIFWPRWKDCTIAFGNTTAGEPAAAASVTIYEVNALPALKVVQAPDDVPRRSLGVSYEDPCSHASDLGATDYNQWLDRMVAFAKYEGINRLTYPVVWYHGPLYPSPTEPVSYFDWSVASPVNRNLYIRWTTHPEDWVEKLLTRFDEEHLEFVSQVTYIRLGSLMQKMNLDLAAIQAGADTINNMRNDDQVQSGAGDWTGQYNVRNFDVQREKQEREGKGWNQCSLQYGEVPNGGGTAGPIFNPVHPVVQDALLRSVREIATRYGKHPSYKGLHIFCYGSSTLGFGSLRFGYDDTTIRLFEQQTGARVPVDANLPKRFSQRYAFLTSKEMRDKWVAWRCAIITDLLCRMRDELVRVRPDLELAVAPSGGRDAGIDADALRKAGVTVTTGMDALSPCASSVTPDAATCRNVNIFNTWIERWGKHAWWACVPGDPQARELAVILGKPAEGICRMGSKYAPDGFWWPEAQLRITPAFSGDVHFMRHYANAVARFDPLTLSRGGLTLDRGHADLLRPFAAAFRTLPAIKFETVGMDTDPVTVRTVMDGGKRYVYLVNREYYPSDVRVNLSNAKGKIVNLSDNRRESATAMWNLKLGAYELQSFMLAPEVGIAGFTATQPNDALVGLTRDAATVLAKMRAAQPEGQTLPPESAALQNQIQDALANTRWAALRQLLESAPVLQYVR